MHEKKEKHIKILIIEKKNFFTISFCSNGFCMILDIITNPISPIIKANRNFVCSFIL